jgi:hypothetical protein
VEPVADRCTDGTAADGAAVVGWRLAGDQQEEARVLPDRTVEAIVEQVIGGGEIVAVEVDGRVGLDEAAREAAIPTAVESSAGSRRRWSWERPCRPGTRARCGET